MKVFYVGEGIEVIVLPDGTKQHPKLSPSERKELNLRIKADKMLEKISSSQQEYYDLKAIPNTVGLTYLEVWTTIEAKKMKPPQAKEYLLDLLRYYVKLRRG